MSMSAEHRTAGHGDTPDSGTAQGGIEPNLPQPDDTRPRQTNLFSPQRRRAAAETALAGPSPAWPQRIEPHHRRPEDISDLDASCSVSRRKDAVVT
jgi:hypothetical protein